MTPLFLHDDVVRELSWLMAEVRCLITRETLELDIDSIYHYIPTLECLNKHVEQRVESCVRCSGGALFRDYYVKKSDILDLLRVLKANDEEVNCANSLIHEDLYMCTDCILCAIIHKVPKRLLLSVLDQIHDIDINGLWPYNPAVIREIPW